MKLVKSALLSTLLFGAIAGCSDDDDTVVTENNSFLRVYHASPDAPAVNVWLDGKPALSGVEYQQSSGQITLPAGSHSVQVDAILADGSTTTVIPSTTVELSTGQEYNLFAAGKVNSGGSGDFTFGPQIVVRDALNPEQARVQVIHAAPDAPTVDVFITPPGADLTSAAPFADDAAYLAATDAVEVRAGAYQIRITDANDPTNVYFDSGTVDVPAGADWVALATNNTMAGGSPVSLLVDTGTESLVVQDVNSGAELRVVHAISDAPGVDVWVDGNAPSAGSPLYNLRFKHQTDYLALPAKQTDFAVAVSGSSPITVVDALALSANLGANQNYTALAIGNLGDGIGNDQLFVVTDDTRRIATEARLRAIHASTLAGNVDIYLSVDASPSSDDIVLQDIPYKGDSSLLSVMPGSLYIMVTPANDMSTVAIGPVMLNLAGGSLTTLVAVDDPASATSVGVISLDD